MNQSLAVSQLQVLCLRKLITHSSVKIALQEIATLVQQDLGFAMCAFMQQLPIEEGGSLVCMNHADQQALYKIALYTLPQNDPVLQRIFEQQHPIIISEDTSISVFWKNLLHHYAAAMLIPICSKTSFWGYCIVAAETTIFWGEYSELFETLSEAISQQFVEKETKDKLYKRNEFYENVLGSLNELMYEIDLRSNQVRLIGHVPSICLFDEVKDGMAYRDRMATLVHPDDAQQVLADIDTFLKSGHNASAKTVYRMRHAERPDTYVWVQARKALLCDEYGEPAMIIGSIADITDTKQVAIELAGEKEKNEFLVQRLQESNEKLNTILNSSQEIILTIDLQTGKIENVNAAIQSLGYTPDEWMGDFYTKWTLEKRKQFHELMRHASESETHVRSQQIVLANKHNTKLIPFEFSTSLFYFKENKYLLCVLRDISERLDYEKNIATVTNQLTHLINNIDDVYAIYNLKYQRYEFVSNNVEGFLGCSKEEFVKHGLFWKEIMHIEDEASIVKQMEQVIKNKSRGEFFYRITTPVGESKMLLEKMTVSVDDEGNADKVYIVKSDYTHIENAEQSLIESERKFRFISENITDFVSILDIDGRFLYASPSAVKVIGYEPEELIGEISVYLVQQEDATTYIEQVLEKAVFQQQESQLRYRILAKSGAYKVVETYFKPIPNTQGQTTSIICSTRDVTEREQLMKELEQSLEKERELNNLRSSFVSTASHQFRTPLTVIQSGVELMEMYLEDLPESKQKPFTKQFTKIHSEVHRLQELMNDVLLLGRADVSRTPFKPEQKDLVAFCQELIDHKYNNRFSADRQVVLQTKGKVVPVAFDPKLLDHALENILSNAYKYSSYGNIYMKLNFEYEEVTIAITDQGIGIPETDLANLFQPFYRAGNTTEIEGTGLGLSIVKEFIDKHNGQIFVVSELNKVTTVNVTLPIEQTP